MKKCKKILVVVLSLFTLLVVGFLFYKNTEIGFLNELVREFKVNQLLSNSPIYISSDSKTYLFNIFNKKPVEIAPIAGIISPDKKEIAYTVDQDWETKLYIYEFDSQKTRTFDININYLFSVNSWSPDSKRIVIIKSAQYVGGLTAYIFDLETKNVVKTFYVIDNNGYWISNNEYVFADPYPDCDSNETCNPTISSVSIYNYATNSVKRIIKLSDSLDIIPILKNNFVEDTDVIVFSKFIAVEQEYIEKDGEEIYYQINLDGGKIKEYTASEDVVYTSIKNSLVNNDISEEMLDYQQNPFDTNWYLVTLESDDNNHRFYIINISDQNNIYKISISGQSAVW